jgi:hypothetical protein
VGFLKAMFMWPQEAILIHCLDADRSKIKTFPCPPKETKYEVQSPLVVLVSEGFHPQCDIWGLAFESQESTWIIQMPSQGSNSNKRASTLIHAFICSPSAC